MYLFVTCAKLLLEISGSGVDMPDGARSSTHLTLGEYMVITLSSTLDVVYMLMVCKMTDSLLQRNESI